MLWDYPEISNIGETTYNRIVEFEREENYNNYKSSDKIIVIKKNYTNFTIRKVR